MFCLLAPEIEDLHPFWDLGLELIAVFVLKCINFFGGEFDFDLSSPRSDWELRSQLYQT